MDEFPIETEERKRYALIPAPPKWDLQAYIAAYLSEGDSKYLAWFLHYYEGTLNRNVQKYQRQFFMPGHFTDLKQAYILGLLKALENYDGSVGTPFAIYKEHYARREVLDYIRSARTGYTAQSLREYAKLRQAMAIWDKYGRSCSEDVLVKIAEEMREKVCDVKDILRGGLLNENATELFRRYADEDGEECTEEIVPDHGSEPYRLWIKAEIQSRLWETFDKLQYEEQSMLAQYCGFCLRCGSVFFMDGTDLNEHGEPKKKLIKPMMDTDIATDHEYSSSATVRRKREAALKKLKEAVKDWI